MKSVTKKKELPSVYSRTSKNRHPKWFQGISVYSRTSKNRHPKWSQGISVYSRTGKNRHPKWSHVGLWILSIVSQLCGNLG
jgi:hypothetical protein